MKNFKSGFVSIVGRPNAGKSTLLNAICGQQIAIVSHKAQTTRNNIRAIYNDDESQIIFTDTPGLHKAETMLGKFMEESAWKALHHSDVLVLMIDAAKRSRGEENVFDKACIEVAHKSGKPFIIVLNKVDLIDKKEVLPIILKYLKLAPKAEIIPVAAKDDNGVDEVIATIKKLLPNGPMYYPADHFTDQSERQIAAELIREQILIYTHKEVPHGVAVNIDSFEEIASDDSDSEYDRSLIRIHAAIICDKDSHKAIIIGKGGASLKRIGTSARIKIEALVGCKVYLELHVKVRSDWRNRRGILLDLGYKDRD